MFARHHWNKNMRGEGEIFGFLSKMQKFRLGCARSVKKQSIIRLVSGTTWKITMWPRATWEGSATRSSRFTPRQSSIRKVVVVWGLKVVTPNDTTFVNVCKRVRNRAGEFHLPAGKFVPRRYEDTIRHNEYNIAIYVRHIIYIWGIGSHRNPTFPDSRFTIGHTGQSLLWLYFLRFWSHPLFLDSQRSGTALNK